MPLDVSKYLEVKKKRNLKGAVMSLFGTICGLFIKNACEEYLKKEEIDLQDLNKSKKKLRKKLRNFLASGWWTLICLFLMPIGFVLGCSLILVSSFFISLLFNEVVQVPACTVLVITFLAFSFFSLKKAYKAIDKKCDFIFSRTRKICDRKIKIKEAMEKKKYEEEQEKQRTVQKSSYTNTSTTNNDNANKDTEALIGCLIWTGLIIYICWLNNFHYFKTAQPNKLIVHDKLIDRFRTIEITEIKNINLLWRLAWRFKYIESDIPCSLIRIDKYKQEADFIRFKSCNAK